jgi:hypothetical protein
MRASGIKLNTWARGGPHRSASLTRRNDASTQRSVEPTHKAMRSWAQGQQVVKTKNVVLTVTIGAVRAHRAEHLQQEERSGGEVSKVAGPGAAEAGGALVAHSPAARSPASKEDDEAPAFFAAFYPLRFSFLSLPVPSGPECVRAAADKAQMASHVLGRPLPWSHQRQGLKCFADPLSALMRLHRCVSALFEDFDMTGAGTLCRIALDQGLEDYGYSGVERDVIFHVINSQHGKISYPQFFGCCWVLSEHVYGLGDLLAEAYQAPVNEDGLRVALDFIAPRAVVLQRKWRQWKLDKHAAAADAGQGEGPEGAGAEMLKRAASEGDWLVKGLAAMGSPHTAMLEHSKRQQLQVARAAKLQCLQLRAALKRKRIAQWSSQMWKHKAKGEWPEALKEIHNTLPLKDARQMVKVMHAEDRLDEAFANKKIWVCEACCRRYNKEARTVFEAAEARKTSTLQDEIWCRIHTLHGLIDFLHSGDEDQESPEAGGPSRGETCVARESWVHGESTQSRQGVLKLPSVSGAFKSPDKDRLLGPRVRHKSEGSVAGTHRYISFNLAVEEEGGGGRGGRGVLRTRPMLPASYPVTEVSIARES